MQKFFISKTTELTTIPFLESIFESLETHGVNEKIEETWKVFKRIF